MSVLKILQEIKVNRVRNWRRCCRRLAQGLFELERKAGNLVCFFR